MSEIRSIAILGATGRLGTQLLAALAEHPRHRSLDIRVLTRPSPWPTEVDSSLLVTVHPIQYGTPSTHEALLRALHGVDVVISTVGDDSGLSSKDVRSIAELPGFRVQDVVAKAAKAAGVKLFVPSSVLSPRRDARYGLIRSTVENSDTQPTRYQMTPRTLWAVKNATWTSSKALICPGRCFFDAIGRGDSESEP